MTIDGYDSDAFTGRISFISSEPASVLVGLRLVQLDAVLHHRERRRTCPTWPSPA